MLIGRMYRKFLKGNKVSIKMSSFKSDEPSKLTLSKYARPNDPMYLMKDTSCPAPFSDTEMFNQWGGADGYEYTHIIPVNNENYKVIVRFSIAKEEARKGINLAGQKPHGKHAAKNIGISIIRAGRELDLDQAWVIQYDPRERWWGCEVEFQPELDEIFGVTNNKQFANNFSELGKIDFDELLKDKTLHQLIDDLKAEEDPKAYLVELAMKINSNLSAMRAIIKAQTKSLEGEPGKARYPTPADSPEMKATEATETRKIDGHSGTSDAQEEKEIEARKKEVEDILQNDGVPNAPEIVNSIFDNKIKYHFVDSEIEGHAFFSVKSRGGKIIISLNTNHPAYNLLSEVLD
jgi:hypothetical protein